MDRTTAQASHEKKPEPRGQGEERFPVTPSDSGENALLNLHDSAGNQAVDALMQQNPSGNPARWNQIDPLPNGAFAAGAGQLLDSTIRREMEKTFGEDFSQVRIHTSVPSTQSARDSSALAYTQGEHIVFQSGRYSPESQRGRLLLAHELAHVLQQRAAGRTTAGKVDTPGSFYERQANQSAQWALAETGQPGLLAAGVSAGLHSPASGAPPAVQRQTAEAQAELERAARIDEINSTMIDLLYSSQQYTDTGLLLNYADKLNKHFTNSYNRPESARTQVASARALVRFYKELRQREQKAPRDDQNALLYTDSFSGGLLPWTTKRPKSLEDIETFSPENITSWFGSAQGASENQAARKGRQGSIARRHTPPPFYQGEGAQPQVQSPAAPAPNKDVRSLVQRQEFTTGEKVGSQQEGGGPDIHKGLAALRQATVGQAKEAVRTQITETSKNEKDPRDRGAKVIRQFDDSTSLLDASGMVVYLASRLFIIDRTGHIVPGDFPDIIFPLQGISRGLEAGHTYFFSEYNLGVTPRERFTKGVLLRVDGGMKVTDGDIFPRDFITGFIPLRDQGRAAIQSGGGIAIIIEPTYGQHHLGISDYSPSKIEEAVVRSADYIDWAILSALASMREHWGEELFQTTVGMGLGYISRLLPPVGIALGVQQAIKIAEWLGAVTNVAAYAQREDEIDLAAQAIAREIANYAIGEIKSAGIHFAVNAGRGAISRSRASRGELPGASGSGEGGLAEGEPKSTSPSPAAPPKAPALPGPDENTSLPSTGPSPAAANPPPTPKATPEAGNVTPITAAKKGTAPSTGKELKPGVERPVSSLDERRAQKQAQQQKAAKKSTEDQFKNPQPAANDNAVPVANENVESQEQPQVLAATGTEGASPAVQSVRQQPGTVASAKGGGGNKPTAPRPFNSGSPHESGSTAPVRNTKTSKSGKTARGPIGDVEGETGAPVQGTQKGRRTAPPQRENVFIFSPEEEERGAGKAGGQVGGKSRRKLPIKNVKAFNSKESPVENLDPNLIDYARKVRFEQVGISDEDFYRNVAVGKVRIRDGKGGERVEYVAAVNIPSTKKGVGHSEPFIFERLQALRTQYGGKNVSLEQLFSERIPCASCLSTKNMVGTNPAIYFGVDAESQRTLSPSNVQNLKTLYGIK